MNIRSSKELKEAVQENDILYGVARGFMRNNELQIKEYIENPEVPDNISDEKINWGFKFFDKTHGDKFLAFVGEDDVVRAFWYGEDNEKLAGGHKEVYAKSFFDSEE